CTAIAHAELAAEGVAENKTESQKQYGENSCAKEQCSYPGAEDADQPQPQRESRIIAKRIDGDEIVIGPAAASESAGVLAGRVCIQVAVELSRSIPGRCFDFGMELHCKQARLPRQVFSVYVMAIGVGIPFSQGLAHCYWAAGAVKVKGIIKVGM